MLIFGYLILNIDAASNPAFIDPALPIATVATGMCDQTDDGIVEIETPVLDHSQSSSNDIQTVELEVRKVDQDYPVNAEEYPELIDEDLDYQSENSVEVDDQNDQKVSGDLPDPEDWENDDVPLFKSDRLDNNDDENLIRKKNLKKYNYVFKNSNTSIEDLEKIPAYKRMGIEINNLKQMNEGNYSKTVLNEENKLEFPDANTDLHDNVD